MLEGIVLAAGASSRMGRPKAALTLGPGGATFAAAAVAALRGGGVPRVLVVAGAHPEAVRAALPRHPAVRVLTYEGWAAGQLSSLLAGIASVESPLLEGVITTLVDVPFVHPDTVRQLVAAWRRTRAPIVRPRIGERHGHPVIFDRAVFARLRATPVEAGARPVLEALAGRIVEVPVDDRGGMRDVDTPEDYRAILGLPAV